MWERDHILQAANIKQASYLNKFDICNKKIDKCNNTIKFFL